MRKLPLALVLALTAISSVAGYFVLQILAEFVSFFMYGSGEIFAAKSGNINTLFAAGQLVVISCLFYRKMWVKKLPVLLLALFIPLGLFLALQGWRVLPD